MKKEKKRQIKSGLKKIDRKPPNPDTIFIGGPKPISSILGHLPYGGDDEQEDKIEGITKPSA